METHDLRRINSRERFRKERQKGNGKRAARRTVGYQLEHENSSTTNIYLGKEWSQGFDERGDEINE